jgi:hypothetical protein
MKFADLGRDPYEHYDDEPDVPEGYIHEDQALEYVFETQWTAVEESVKADAAERWLRDGKPWLDLLNIVSQHDKEHLREAIRKGIAGGGSSLSDDIVEPQSFRVASDVARLLESMGSPRAKYCMPSDDFAWANSLIKLTRAFREILFLISEPGDSWMVHYHLGRPISELNSALAQGRPAELKWRPSDSKTLEFHREVDSQLTPLHSVIAEWMCEFLMSHSASLGLAVCTECGTIFVRARRDNVYCSKTCQNRVAYKRKKIFESGVLVEEKIDAAAPSALVAGVWLNHPRLGLGRIEAARFTDRKLWVKFKDHRFAQNIPNDSTAEEYLERVSKDAKAKPVEWEEIVDPGSIEVRVRFLQLARSFRSWELFPNDKKTDSIPTFYRVVDPATLADLL